jgi:hypothetical protein
VSDRSNFVQRHLLQTPGTSFVRRERRFQFYGAFALRLYAAFKQSNVAIKEVRGGMGPHR